MKISKHNHLKTNIKPPLSWLISAVLLTVLMFSLLGWHVHYSFLIINNLQHIYINEDYHWHKVIDLSRQITAAARAAVIDPNLDNEQLEKYHQIAAELDTLLVDNKIAKFSIEDNNIDPLIEAKSAQKILRTIEQSALKQMQSGKPIIGLKRLFDEDYKMQEQVFIKAMNNFIDQSRHRLIDQLQEGKSKELQSLWAAFFVFLVSLSFWIMLIRRLQKWGGILSQEILEHQKAEEIANKLEMKYYNLFEYANDPILIIDPTTYHLFDVNQKAADLLGYDRDELLGLRLNDLIIGDDQNPIEQIFKISGKSAVSECLYRRKDGHLFPVEISGRLIDAGDKEVYQCFARDITERKRFQEERLHSQKIEAIGQVADGIAHDFRNALTAISGYNALGQDLLPEHHPALESLKRIDQVIGQANGLIKGLLTFSRRQETERQSVELRHLIENSSDLFRRILPATITLEIDVASVQNFQVSADVTQLQQVLLNLMINARDAMPDGGTLRISLSPAPADRGDGSDAVGWVRIEVSDTGVGMPPEIQARIFEPFFTTKPDEYGTGLGLAMVHNIVSQHDGRVEVRSTVGQGSIFTVLLPPATLDSIQDDAISSRNWKSGAGEMILLAEDHRYVREIMAATLRHVGYEVVQAEDGLALLDRYQAHRDHLRLLIADLDLPGCSGLDGLRQLRARGARLPAILITGIDSRDLSDQLDMETLLLRKPFQMATLARLVYSLLHQEARIDDQTHLDRSG